jgi:hypothetical protein
MNSEFNAQSPSPQEFTQIKGKKKSYKIEMKNL